MKELSFHKQEKMKRTQGMSSNRIPNKKYIKLLTKPKTKFLETRKKWKHSIPQHKKTKQTNSMV
jgi:hypothetical protein